MILSYETLFVYHSINEINIADLKNTHFFLTHIYMYLLHF